MDYYKKYLKYKYKYVVFKNKLLQFGNGGYEDDIRLQFINKGINFNEKRCLDIGTRNGLNCITLINLGAREVIGIDIDDTRFNEMPSNDKIKLVKTDLLELDDAEKFDVITCFLWNMPLPLYNKIIQKIISLLKIDGIIYIGFHDELYKYDKYGGSVPDLLIKNFNNVKILDRDNPYQWIMEASGPLL